MLTNNIDILIDIKGSSIKNSHIMFTDYDKAKRCFDGLKRHLKDKPYFLILLVNDTAIHSSKGIGYRL